MGGYEEKTAVVVKGRTNKDSGKYEEVNQEFCDGCGHEIIWDEEGYCPFCGEPLKKDSSGSSQKGGGVFFLVCVIAAVIWLLSR